MNKNLIFRVIIKIVVFISIAVMLLYGVVVLTSNNNVSNGKIPGIFGFNYLPVSNDTMEPLLYEGEMIIVANNDFVFEDNQIVVVKLNENNKEINSNSLGDFYIVKVVSIIEDTFTATLYDTTQPHNFSTDQIVGKASYSVPFLGKLINLFLSSNGIIFFLGIPLLLTIAGLIVNYRLKLSDDFDREKAFVNSDDKDSSEDEEPPAIDIMLKNEEVDKLPMVSPAQKSGKKRAMPLPQKSPILVDNKESANKNVDTKELDFASDLFNTNKIEKPAENKSPSHPMFKNTQEAVPVSVTKKTNNIEDNVTQLIKPDESEIFNSQTQKKQVKATNNDDIKIKNINPIQIDNMSTQELSSVLNNVFLDNPSDFNVDLSELHKSIDSIVNERKDELLKQENDISLAETMSLELALLKEQINLTSEFSTDTRD